MRICSAGLVPSRPAKPAAWSNIFLQAIFTYSKRHCSIHSLAMTMKGSCRGAMVARSTIVGRSSTQETNNRLLHVARSVASSRTTVLSGSLDRRRALRISSSTVCLDMRRASNTSGGTRHSRTSSTTQLWQLLRSPHVRTGTAAQDHESIVTLSLRLRYVLWPGHIERMLPS